MDPIALALGISWTVAGLVIIGISIPLARGRVGRNRLYGIRFPNAFESDEAWYAINRHGGRCLIAWAVPLVVVGVACFFIPFRSHTSLTLVLGFAPLIFVLVPAFQAWRFARNYRAGT